MNGHVNKITQKMCRAVNLVSFFFFFFFEKYELFGILIFFGNFHYSVILVYMLLQYMIINTQIC